MLIQFRVENHRSLRDEQILSMVAAGTDDRGEERLIRPPRLGQALLPAVGLYGANASGKSNVIGALGFMRDAVLESQRFWEPSAATPQEPFALSGKANEPSLYEVDILVGGVRYRYGFVLGSTRIEEEWLHVWPHGRKQTWFQREGDDFDFGKNLHGENEVIRGLTRTNSLFLSAAAQNNHAVLFPIFNWFRAARLELRRGSVRWMVPGRTAFLGELFSGQLSLYPEDNDSRQRERDAIVRLLQAADIGILDIRVTAREPSGLESLSGRRAASKAWPSLRSAVSISASRRATSTSFEIQLRHKSESPDSAWLPLDVESAGTITLLGIAIHLVGVLREGGLLCVDEIEASLHPMLALELVRLFNAPEHNPHGAQLIFTTHDTNLLGNVLGEPPLRRDQIWFTEKDDTGATHLYPLTDYHPRKEENLERGYLQGRYGAVPFLGQLFDASSDSTEE
jgi:hypothetical protein